MDIEQAKMTLNTYFQMVDTVNKISITGGEPLLNGDLGEIIREIYKYENQILDEIIMVTNGTILLKETLLQILKCNPKVKVIINNYGEISKYAEQNYQDLKKWDIRSVLYDENNRYGWIDCRNHDLKHKTERDKERQAQSCAFFQGKKYVINRGKLYTCTRSAYRIQENVIPYTENDYIDLLDNDTDIMQKREKLFALTKLKYTMSCAYCNGLIENSKKYKAAEQLKS